VHINALLTAVIQLHQHMSNFNTWIHRYNKCTFFLMIFPYEKGNPNAARRQQNGRSMQAVAVSEKMYGYVCLCELLFALIHTHKRLRAI